MTPLLPEWGPALTSWSAWMTAARRSPETIRLRLYQVGRFATGTPDPWTVTVDDLTEWLAAHRWAAETARSYRASLRSFYQWAHLTRRIEADPSALLPAVRVPIGQPRPAPEAVYRGGLELADARVGLMLALAWCEGLRRGEIARIHSEDLEPDLEGWTLRVTGKGGRVRRVPLLTELAGQLRALPAGFAFPGKDDGHLSPRWVGRLIADALPGGWTAHPLRHAFATRTHAASGHDLRVVQELLGHSSLATTQRYVAVDDAAKRDAVRRAA